MDKNVSFKITYFTFCSNILILLHHANLNGYINVSRVQSIIMNWFSALSIPAMSYFFFISAFLFYRNFRIEKLLDKWKEKIATLVLPYVIWNAIPAAFRFIKLKGCVEEGVVKFLFNTFVFYNGIGCANGPLWYMFRLISFILAAPFVFYVIKNKKIIFFVIEGVLIVINIVLKVSYFDFLYFLPIYLLGAYIGFNYNVEFEIFLKGKYNYFKCFISILCIIIMSFIAQFNLIHETGIFLVRILIMIPLIWFASSFVVNKKPCQFVRGGGGNVDILLSQFSLSHY